MYRTLLQAVLDPTVAIDEFGTIVLASDSVEKVFGWAPEELRGRNVKVLMPEPHRGRHDEYLATYRRTGATGILGRRREFEILRKDGAKLVCELSVARAEMPEGTPTLFIGSFRDITARRAAEQALEANDRLLRAVFERSFQFMGLLRPDGTVVEVNHAALEVVGATRDEVIGKPFWETPWWKADSTASERLRAAVSECSKGKFVRFETVHRSLDGELLNIDFSLNPVMDSSGVVELLIPEGRDITQLKRAQRAETAMMRDLATIGESAALLAHEIKNPITAVNAALRAVAKHLGEDERLVLEDLAGRMQRLEGLMRRTLSFTKPLNLRLAPIDARELMELLVRNVRAELADRGAELRVDVAAEPIVFSGDRQLIEEVFVNLIKNALEVTPPATLMILSARRAGDGGTVLALEDNGPGIPPALRESLFRPFSTTRHDGTGLGLAFCRKVVEEHGGTIEVRSCALGGARFEIRLPSHPLAP